MDFMQRIPEVKALVSEDMAHQWWRDKQKVRTKELTEIS